MSVAELLFRTESLTVFGGVTVTVLVTCPVAVLATVAVTVKVAVPFGIKVTDVLIEPEPFGAAQLEPADAVQVHDALVSVAGKGSVTEAFGTVLGPLFLATIM